MFGVEFSHQGDGCTFETRGQRDSRMFQVMSFVALTMAAAFAVTSRRRDRVISALELLLLVR
jgi:hypothetical protein